MTASLTGRICPKPFMSAEFHLQGDVYVCCPKWLSTPIGNIEKNSIEEIWNSSIAKDIRQSIIDGTYSYCDKQLCPFIQAGALPTLEQLPEKVRTQVQTKQTSLDNLPVEVMLNYDLSCNLTCPSCRTEKISHVPGSAPYVKSSKYTDLIYGKFIESLGENHLRLNITGSGDPFASQQYRQLLERLDGKALPNLRIELQTNGLLLTPHTWSRLERIHKNIDVINVSIDAATEETYLKIRRGGNWEMILSNAKFLGDLRRQKKVRHIQANMVVQKGNYREMPAFAELFLKLGFDSISLSLLTDWKTWAPDVFQEQIVWREDHKEYQDFLDVLTHRSLSHHRVFIGNIAEYRTRARSLANYQVSMSERLSSGFFEVRRRRYFLPKKIQDVFVKLGIFR